MNRKMAQDTIYAYTDGSSLGNPGPGGWGIVILRPGAAEWEEHSGSPGKSTTNNQMELQATIEAMKLLQGTGATIRSDSEYVVNAINKGWLKRWAGNGWATSEKEPVKNQDLWEQLLNLKPESFKFESVKGHSGVPENERADRLAKAAANADSPDPAVQPSMDGMGAQSGERVAPAGGRAAGGMVDVGGKQPTLRIAVAAGEIVLKPATLEKIAAGAIGKGDVLGMARTAGVMAAKRTAELLPLCHQIPLNYVDVQFEMRAGAIAITAEARAHWKTGVEMEALLAVAAAGLTIYDMCKSVDDGMEIKDVRLMSKSGGLSGRGGAND